MPQNSTVDLKSKASNKKPQYEMIIVFILFSLCIFASILVDQDQAIGIVSIMN